MLTQFIRVFKGVAGSPIILSDFSLENADRDGILYDKDFLYIAQKYSFNQIFLLMKVVNTLASKIKVEYYTSEGWKEAVDVIDGSKGMKKSGLVQFSLQRNHQWLEISDTKEDTGIPDELKPIAIIQSFWLRISFTSVVPNPLTSISAISYAFTNTAKINAIDLEAPGYYATISASTGEATKADWILEIITACEMMVAEMKEANILKAPGQIILLDDFFLPAAYRTLAHIYFNLGKSYDERRRSVRASYEKFLAGTKTIDIDQNARAEKSEQGQSFGRLRR